MRPARKLGLALTTLAFAGTGLPSPSSGDPVTEARSHRAQNLGISEGDLPAVPKGIIEPPPLPPPEIHPKDARRGSRRAGMKKVGMKKKGTAKGASRARTTKKAARKR